MTIGSAREFLPFLAANFSTENTFWKQPSQKFCEAIVWESCHCGMDVELGRKTEHKEQSRQE